MELLVVIGIIALLISILLPALNKARQAANVVYCQSNLRQIFDALQIYAGRNRDYLPYGSAQYYFTGNSPGLAFVGYTSAGISKQWTWADAVSIVQGQPVVPDTSSVANLYMPVLIDKDTLNPLNAIQPLNLSARPTGWSQQNQASYANVCHYTANPRVFPNLDVVARDYASSCGQAQFFAYYPHVRTFASIKHPADKMILWDGGQMAYYNYGAYPVADFIDGNAWMIGHCFTDPPTVHSPSLPWIANQNNTTIMTRLLGIGTSGTTMAALQIDNVDLTDPNQPLPQCGMRFRHRGNSAANVLFGDGHVESRALGQVVVKDVLVSYWQ